MAGARPGSVGAGFRIEGVGFSLRVCVDDAPVLGGVLPQLYVAQRRARTTHDQKSANSKSGTVGFVPVLNRTFPETFQKRLKGEAIWGFGVGAGPH